VRSTQGALSIAVADDVRSIAEGAAYRVVLEPPSPAAAHGRGSVGSKANGQGPVGAGKSKFAWFAVTAVGLVTFLAVDEAVESPDRP
jgi:hypothetical protein